MKKTRLSTLLLLMLILLCSIFILASCDGVVKLPEAVPACTHSFTVLDPSNLYLCCEFCDEYLRVSEVESVYIGDTIRFIGDVVAKEDISVTLYYENGTILNCANFTLNDTTLQNRTNSVQIICGDDYWYGYVQVYAYPVGSSFTEEGFAYIEENGAISIVGYKGANMNVIVPETINSKPVTTIGKEAFYHSDISTVDLPDSLISIEDLAFHSCYNLKTITIPKNVINIGIYAFAFSGLTEIFIPENIEVMGSSVLRGCNSLMNITVSENNQRYSSVDGNLYSKDGTILENYALGKVASSFIIPEHVLEISCDAFSFSNNLISVTISKNVKIINVNAFYNYNTNLVSVVFENTEGWLINGEAVDVSDSEQNVLNLTDTCSDYMWYIINDTNPDGDDSGGSGNIEDDDSGNADHTNEDNEQEITENPVSYSKFQAEWYAKEFSKFNFSYAKEFLAGIESDDAITLAMNTWSGIHLVADPSYAVGELSKEDLYVIVIYDLLTGNSGEFENPMDLFESDFTGYMYDAVKILFGTSDVEMDWDMLKKIDLEAYDSSKLNGTLFDNMDMVEHVFATFDNLYDALEACARYQAISNMSEGFKNVLQAVHDDKSNEYALRNAALKCIKHFEDAANSTMEDILAQEYMYESTEYILKVFIAETWGYVVKNIFPEVMSIQFAFQGVAILGDTLFNLDATTEALYQLKVVVGFENAIRKILADNQFDYADPNKCSNYIYAVETFQRTVLLGLDYSESLLRSRVDSFGISNAKKEEYLAEIDTIVRIKADRLNTYRMFEGISQKMYQIYYDLEIDSTLTPVAQLMLSLAVGSFTYEGSYYMLFDSVCASMEDAKAFCESLGGHLTIIDSQEENDAVYSGLVSLGYRNAFFGLTDSQKEGTWLTVTGNSPTYTNWHSGEPNSESSSEDWAMFYWKYTNGQWNDGNFTGTVSGGKAFICEWD